jgi:hypothetical protein
MKKIVLLLCLVALSFGVVRAQSSGHDVIYQTGAPAAGACYEGKVIVDRVTGAGYVRVAGVCQPLTALSVPASRAINTSSPVTGGGDLSADRTIACATCGVTGTGLNQFASTTSAQLAGVISDESGASGGFVRSGSPNITTPTGIVKGDVGLGNVDNTSDANKPVSTAQQTALNLKANLASPTFTGTVIVPSPVMIGTKSLTLSNSVTISGTDGDTLTSAPPTYTAPSLLNSWVDFGSGYSTSGYLKHNGVVYLKGVLKSGTVNTTFFTLPAGYRPSATLVFAVISNVAISQVNIDSSGNVTMVSGSNVSVSLDNIRFAAGQ